MTKLPYEFDLLYDIKTLEQAYRVMKELPDCSDADPEDVYELLVKYDLPVPDWYVAPTPEQPVAWLDGNGSYLTYKPTFSELGEYTPVYSKPQNSTKKRF